jgi:hypothetical protein
MPELPELPAGVRRLHVLRWQELIEKHELHGFAEAYPGPRMTPKLGPPGDPVMYVGTKGEVLSFDEALERANEAWVRKHQCNHETYPAAGWVQGSHKRTRERGFCLPRLADAGPYRGRGGKRVMRRKQGSPYGNSRVVTKPASGGRDKGSSPRLGAGRSVGRKPQCSWRLGSV